ncbi:hypothetical protein AB3H50_28355 [Bacillus pacificus]|uniref:Uncharacterized protein n=2 Tax=Bacillus cereus TaxID=1396 RepID=A0A2A8ZXG1_BACCE|nr:MULTISPECIES: hypothetical protein [Bacillus cereus group]EJP81478.1 hypothetical protein IC1_06261 [Bacillus cereus VD022]EOQ58040.1 hypothetical protein IAY_06698 [Bacillus cereus TIAC219]OJE43707.1 hypothetical protein BAQ44_04880 [Bacillus mobilis]PEC51339.1 hypothetical protein CON05_28855 [Bacillus cereus]PFE13462.1 hypothetical protein CN307_17920 [Bacillus cereus]
MAQCIKQTGPTCGIYAFINGMYHINQKKDVSKKQADKMVYSFLEANIVKDDSNSKTGTTFVGEFFDFESYISFLNKIKNTFIYKNIDYDIKIKDVNYLDDISVIEDIQKQNCFVLFSIATPISWWNPIKLYRFLKKGSMISHWIPLYGYDNKKNKFIVANSSSGKIKRFSLKTLAKKNKRLKSTTFYWKYYKRSKKRFTFKKNPIEDLVQAQLKSKKDFLDKGILIPKINHTSGKIIIVKKIEK